MAKRRARRGKGRRGLLASAPRRRRKSGLMARLLGCLGRGRRRRPKARRSKRPLTRTGFIRKVRSYFTRVFVVLAIIFGGIPIASDLTLAALRPMQSNKGVTCRVINVVDGDTLDVLCAVVRYRVRLTGYDAPELFSPQCNAERVAASAAKWYLRSLFWRGEKMRITFGGIDLYQRHLARIDIDGFNLADRMIAVGYGRVYDGGQRGGWCSVGAGAHAIQGAILSPDME